MRKTKIPQPMMSNQVQGRDLFQTPNYAVDLLVPFIPKVDWIWECACGDGKIVQRLNEHGFTVYPSDIRKSSGWVRNWVYDFIVGEKPNLIPFYKGSFAIVTNPPFSLKQKFYNQCIKEGVPFALLIPADYSGWIIDACRLDGAEKIIPTRRIDYITPNILTRIHESEVFNVLLSERDYFELKLDNLRDVKDIYPGYWKQYLEKHEDIHNYKSINDVPQELLWKYSSSDFHSMWLTWGFNLGKTETYVELTLEEKKNNI